MLHAVKVRGNTSSLQSPVEGSKQGLRAMIFEHILMSLDSLALDQKGSCIVRKFHIA